jgi:hydrogenase nickel incorporation protein HypB
MCDTCGCEDHTHTHDIAAPAGKIPVIQNILGANDQAAHHNRAHFAELGMLAVNIMSSPGSGKTTLLLATIAALQDKFKIGVIEGDVASQIDAERIATTGAPVVQINTGGGCHLDAPQVHNALHALPECHLDVIFIENVGNLICPVAFDLGETRRVALLSVPEGDDKPYKYPGIFEAVDMVVVTKSDLLPVLDFDLEAFQALVHGLNSKAQLITLSAKTGAGMAEWLAWIEAQKALISPQ